MRRILFGIVALLLAGQASPAQSLPELKNNGAARQLFVDGSPFLILGGELHNSSASSTAYMKALWPRLEALHLNTVIGTVSWELLEPEEGKFDFTLVDDQIRDARQHGMRLVLIWFATWKNATSTYVPLWVKKDARRFPRAVTRPSPEIDGVITRVFGSSFPAPNLSAFGMETLNADARAFRALMRHIREVDPHHTVIMMQVENETGILGDSRDRSPLAEAAWSKPVPPEFLQFLGRNRANLLPELTEVWGAHGFKTSGTWAEVFGADRRADEVFMAWHVGRYVGKVIAAGKEELALPMYANAWLGPQAGMDLPGQYPSGGPVARMIDVWHAAAPSADILAPDIYVKDFKGTCDLYARAGNPLFIPEARPIVGDLFWALGRHAAIGFSPFGIEDVKPDNPLADAYALLGNMHPLVTSAAAGGKLLAVMLDDESTQTAVLGGYRLSLRSAHARGRQDDARPYGMVLATAADEFLVVGSGFEVVFSSESPDTKSVEIGAIDEGTFEKGRWIPGRRLNGDEQHAALAPGHVGAIQVRLYRSN